MNTLVGAHVNVANVYFVSDMKSIFTVETKQAKRITGVALMGRHVYVTSSLCKTIEVFNVEDSCSRMSDITIDELSSPQDIVCVHTSEKLLFIFDTNLRKRFGQVWKYKVAKKKTCSALGQSSRTLHTLLNISRKLDVPTRTQKLETCSFLSR